MDLEGHYFAWRYPLTPILCSVKYIGSWPITKCQFGKNIFSLETNYDNGNGPMGFIVHQIYNLRPEEFGPVSNQKC